jgi:hypothetical protein
MKTPYIPEGCDQQGRFPEAVDVAPPPAEAATDLGADDAPQHSIMRVILGDLVIAVALVGVIVMVLWGVMR